MDDAVELAVRLKIDHVGKTADQRGMRRKWKMPLQQFGVRLTRVGLLSFYIAQEIDFGRKLLQRRVVSYHS